MSAQPAETAQPWADLLAAIEEARDRSLASHRAKKRRQQSAWHRNMMTEFYAAREAWEIRREAVTRGYDSENVDYAEFNTPYTLRRHLEGLARQR